MSSSLVALLATAIHQFQNPEDGPVSLERTLGLLARAADGAPVVLECTSVGISVNGEQLSDSSPGVALLSDALASHHTGRLQLPGGMEPRHWRGLAELYAGVPAIFENTGQVLAALRVVLPMTEIWAQPGSNGAPSPQPQPQKSGDTSPNRIQEWLSTDRGNLGDFSSRLSQLHNEGNAAAKIEDLDELSRVLLEFRTLERTGDPAQASVVAKERRRVISPSLLDWLLRMVTKPGTPASLPMAMATLGTEELERILGILGTTTNLRDRDQIARIFEQVEDLQGLVLLSFRGGAPSVICGAAEIAGRRQLIATIPVLSGLLRHNDADVRTAAWRALEAIGTRDAIEALTAKGR